VAGGDAGPTSWGTAAQATRHCLTGCAAGEVAGMVLAAAFGWAAGTTIAVSLLLAFVLGYALTVRGVLRTGLGFGPAVRTAFAADTVSIATMEVVDNGFIALIPGALAAGLGTVLFWWTLALSLGIAFLVAWPVNRWLITRGKGHAVVHRLHSA
jgi:hypothetical protein